MHPVTVVEVFGETGFFLVAVGCAVRTLRSTAVAVGCAVRTLRSTAVGCAVRTLLL
jgi:hypothetical protein